MHINRNQFCPRHYIRNCNPIILELKAIDSEEGREYNRAIKEGYKRITADYDLIYEEDSYEETLEMVKKLDPLIIIPGTEKGVILATKLANDLNLLCNPIENLNAMTLKNEMQNRLAEKNLRSIKGKAVKSLNEAIEFYDKENLKEVVLKPIYSAGSVGVHICLNKEEMIESFEEVLRETGYYGNVHDKILIQERIKGTEYIVNTVSSNGLHRVTTIWKYGKITTPEGGQIYDYQTSLNELGLGESELVEYAYDVADALGIKYGAVHGEYMIDEKGPVLIEVNCRPMGTSFEAAYLDKISGQHETDSILDSYLNPEKFNLERKKGYKLLEHGMLKFFSAPKDLIAKSSPIYHISNKLKSHYKTSLKAIRDDTRFVKTQDLDTAIGIVYLVHKNPYQLTRDLEFLKSIEEKASQLVLSEELNKDKSVKDNRKEIENLIKDIKGFGTCLLISDRECDDTSIMHVSPNNLKEINGKFDIVIVNISRSLGKYKDDAIAKFTLNTFNRIKDGGLVIIPQSTFDNMPNGRLGAEALVKTLDLKIELPLHQFPKMIIASKR